MSESTWNRSLKLWKKLPLNKLPCGHAEKGKKWGKKHIYKSSTKPFRKPNKESIKKKKNIKKNRPRTATPQRWGCFWSFELVALGTPIPSEMGSSRCLALRSEKKPGRRKRKTPLQTKRRNKKQQQKQSIEQRHRRSR